MVAATGTPTDPTMPMQTPRPELSDAAALGRLRLMQLVSPALPIGGFTYSQGLEWAVEAGWVGDSDTLADWLGGLIDDGLAGLDLPVLKRLYHATEKAEFDMVEHWGRQLCAHRETAELRAEERNRARALTTLLADLGVVPAEQRRECLLHCQAAPFALAAVHWQIGLHDCLLGYAWGWLENQVAAAIKLVPLGQTDGQRVLLVLAGRLPAAVERAMQLEDEDIGAAAPALAIASANHEVQYTRLFRS